MDRRLTILEAAIRVLARSGSRGLTHRAVDADAGVASGSTSNVFRTRQALVGAVVYRLLENDQQRLDRVVRANSTSPSAGAVAAAFVDETLSTARDDVLARASLLTDPDAQELRAARSHFLAFGSTRRFAADLLPQAIHLVVAFIDGILLDGALYGTRLDARSIAEAVDRLVLPDGRADP